ncbi:MAG TPA: hypothetical protein VE783_13130 [Candidatus Limnocylindrales bacterium]|nr:hypothetical protein [Candidatus Limnocylindrales bacterium]
MLQLLSAAGIRPGQVSRATAGGRIFRATILLLLLLALVNCSAFAQGGPPFYTNDPGTPGNLNLEVNVSYMPFLYTDQSVSHLPDLDINLGLGKRVQLTYENAWLRVQAPDAAAKFGLGQSNLGIKWRFYEGGDRGISLSFFPQVLLNNPNNSTERGITAEGNSFLLPMQFTKDFGAVSVDCEGGYQLVQKAPNGWLAGVVVGRKISDKLEIAAEVYSQGAFHSVEAQPTVDAGARYKVGKLWLLMMAGRSLQASSSTQSSFVGYFGVQMQMHKKPWKW